MADSTFLTQVPQERVPLDENILDKHLSVDEHVIETETEVRTELAESKHGDADAATADNDETILSMFHFTPENNEMLKYYYGFHTVESQIVSTCVACAIFFFLTWKTIQKKIEEIFLSAYPADVREQLSTTDKPVAPLPVLFEPRHPICIGVIGCGRMGTLILESLLYSGYFASKDIYISTRQPQHLNHYAKQGVNVSSDNDLIMKTCRIVLLCCLPHQVQSVVASLELPIPESTCVLSILSSTSLQKLEQLFKTNFVIRTVVSLPESDGPSEAEIAAFARMTCKRLEYTIKSFVDRLPPACSMDDIINSIESVCAEKFQGFQQRLRDGCLQPTVKSPLPRKPSYETTDESEKHHDIL